MKKKLFVFYAPFHDSTWGAETERDREKGESARAARARAVEQVNRALENDDKERGFGKVACRICLQALAQLGITPDMYMEIRGLPAFLARTTV